MEQRSSASYLGRVGFLIEADASEDEEEPGDSEKSHIALSNVVDQVTKNDDDAPSHEGWIGLAAEAADSVCTRL